jgi:hypothetical protein
LSSVFFLLLFTNNSGLVELFFSISQFLSGFESFFLSFNNLLSGNFFLDFTLNNLDGIFNLSNEILEVLDLLLNCLLLIGEKIMLLLGGDLG